MHQLGLTPQEIAVICASHSGEPRHLEAVLSILGKIGCSKHDLQCGVHTPLYYEALGRQPKANEVFTPLHHNCSGKHAGMLALCKLFGTSIESYLDQHHPVQEAIFEAVAHFSGTSIEAIGIGMDGCSAPNFALPLAALALGYARLACGASDPRYGEAPNRIFVAMTQYPEMVAGIKRLDTILMQAGQGDWVSKTGAEGVQGIGIRSRDWGIAIKITDGATRALPVVAVETLRQLGLMPVPLNPALALFAPLKITNQRGIETGEVRPVFALR
jgi:L-asparaginase II